MKQIPLSQGKFALVDDEDYEFINQWKWCIESGGYAVRSVHIGYFDGKRKQKRVWMHREVNKTPDNMDTDHIDMNRLNNQKENLRTTTRSQNKMNVKSRNGSVSKYKGVYFEKRTKRWFAQIRLKSGGKALGTFATQEEAALAYNEAAIKYFGEFCRLNEVKYA